MIIIIKCQLYELFVFLVWSYIIFKCKICFLKIRVILVVLRVNNNNKSKIPLQKLNVLEFVFEIVKVQHFLLFPSVQSSTIYTLSDTIVGFFQLKSVYRNSYLLRGTRSLREWVLMVLSSIRETFNFPDKILLQIRQLKIRRIEMEAIIICKCWNDTGMKIFNILLNSHFNRIVYFRKITRK